MAIRPVRVTARGSQEAPIDGQQMLRQLDEQLTGICGPFKQQVFVPQPTRLKTVVHAGKPKVGNAVYRLLNELGFTANKLTTSGYYGGIRLEIGGEMTVVNYNNYSGVVSISTNLKFKG